MANINQIKLPSGSTYDLNDKRIATVGDAVAKNVTTSITGSANLPTDLAVKTFVEGALTGKCDYLGTVSSAEGLSATAGKGDFYRASADFEITSGVNVHAGDIVIAEKDNPAVADYSVIHGEFTDPAVVTDGYSDADTTHASSANTMKEFASFVMGKAILDTDIAIGADASTLDEYRIYYNTASNQLCFRHPNTSVLTAANSETFYDIMMHKCELGFGVGRQMMTFSVPSTSSPIDGANISYINSNNNDPMYNYLTIQRAGSLNLCKEEGDYYTDSQGNKESWGMYLDQDEVSIHHTYREMNGHEVSREATQKVEMCDNALTLSNHIQVNGGGEVSKIEINSNRKIDFSPASGKTADITINGDTPLDSLFTATVSDGVLTLGFGIK